MENAAGYILRGDSVKFEGRFYIGQDEKSPNSSAGGHVSPEAVHIVESSADFAVIEVACSCGATMQIRCEYDTPKGVEQESST